MDDEDDAGESPGVQASSEGRAPLEERGLELTVSETCR
ncbi:hypothetical protein VDGD_20400 [Verticillium dahliae]|nr:hypothetical protein VDGD_20400 [Verticillium dahliae]